MANSAAPTVLTLDDLRIGASTTARFVGAEHNSGTSFYVSRDEPGSGPDLHTHPYSETFVIHAGTVRFTVGDQVIDVQAGDILVVPSGTPHGFTNIGNGPMHSVNIHASARMEQIDLQSRRREDGSFELLD